MEGIERPVMKTLEEEKEAENRRDTERRRKEPTGLSERVDEKNTLTKTAMGPENAIALYGRIPMRRASSN